MATQTIYFLIFVAVATPIIWWLMWREDFDGRQSEWRFNRERKNREHLSPPQFYDCYYQTSGIDRNVVNRLLSICAKQFAVEATLIRPGDDYFRIFNVDAIEF